MQKIIKILFILALFCPFLEVSSQSLSDLTIACPAVEGVQCRTDQVMKWKSYGYGCRIPYCEDVNICPAVALPDRPCNGIWTMRKNAQGCDIPYCKPSSGDCPDIGDPYCGRKPINCITSPCPESEPQTYPNLCELQKDGAMALYRGTCRSKPFCPEVIPPYCPNGKLVSDVLDNGCKTVRCKDSGGCPDIYKPVCGRLKGKSKTYANRCELRVAKAQYKHSGACNDYDEDPTQCYEIYKPVCAVYKRSNVKSTPITMANDCKAKVKGMTILYEGQCKKSTWPSACTLEYKPQCGRVDGKLKTYSNMCLLEKAGATFVHADKCGKECNEDSGPVCAVSREIHNNLGGQVTYANECDMKQAYAQKLYNGPCKDSLEKDLRNKFPGCKLIFDGCNTCSISSNGRMRCTQRACLSYDKEPARCLDDGYEQPGFRKKLLSQFPGCRKIFDGCNVCTIKTPTNISCTQQACKAGTEKPAQCLDSGYDKSRVEDLISDFPGCRRIFDGCNVCTINKNGRGSCTKKACAPGKRKEPQCLDKGSGRPPNPGDLIKKFPNCKRIYDGCNTCSVTDSGQMACTQKGCEEYQPARCLDAIKTDHDDILRRYNRYKQLVQKRPRPIRTTNATRSNNRRSLGKNGKLRSINKYNYKTYRKKKLGTTWRERMKRWREQMSR